LAQALKDNPAGIRAAMDTLNQVWSTASTNMYQKQSDAQAPPSPGDSSTGGGASQPNVEEADYTIVDDK